MTRKSRVPIRTSNGRRHDIDLRMVERGRVEVMIDLVRESLDREGFGTIVFADADTLMGAQRHTPGTAAAGYVRDWSRAGWIEVKREHPRSKSVQIRWTHKGMQAFADEAFAVPYTPVVATPESVVRGVGAFLAEAATIPGVEVRGTQVIVGRPAPVEVIPPKSVLRALCDEIEDLLTRPATACDHAAELEELAALRAWRDAMPK